MNVKYVWHSTLVCMQTSCPALIIIGLSSTDYYWPRGSVVMWFDTSESAKYATCSPYYKFIHLPSSESGSYIIHLQITYSHLHLLTNIEVTKGPGTQSQGAALSDCCWETYISTWRLFCECCLVTWLQQLWHLLQWVFCAAAYSSVVTLKNKLCNLL